GSASVERDGGGSQSFSAIHGGIGAVFRAGERLGFKLDGRNVSYKQEGGPGRDTRVNTFFVSAGVTAFWLGRSRDSDEDGVPDKGDRCPATPTGAVVDAGGCPLDTDGDKVFDGLDKCTDTPAGSIVDMSGCPLDRDGDGIPDGVDICPETPVGASVNAGGCPLELLPREQELLDTWMIRLTDLEFRPDSARILDRSEEHTSELQSR